MKEAVLLRLASRQHGLMTMSQLLDLGFTERRNTFEFRVMAAVLAAGDGAIASHRCAAVLYGLRRIRCDVPVITVSGRSAPRLPGIEGHRRDTLTPSDRTRVGVIPVTTPARTVLDLAAVLDLTLGTERARLGGVIDDALVRKLTSMPTMERLLERVAGSRVPGAAVLSELLAERRAGKQPSETGLEDELLEVFRAFGLPEPVRQYVLALPNGGTARFDAAYPELLLGFEADGDRHHKGLLDRMRDEGRDEQCGLIGWTVRRYGTEDIRRRPAGIADDVARLRARALAA